jgi:hypothetical protein
MGFLGARPTRLESPVGLIETQEMRLGLVLALFLQGRELSQHEGDNNTLHGQGGTKCGLMPWGDESKRVRL